MTEIKIGIDSELGSGTNKIVYNVKGNTNKAETLFITDLPLDNLVIASMEPDRQEDNKPGIKLIKPSYIERYLVERRINFTSMEQQITENKLIKEVIDELKLHQKYAIYEPQMAPKLYKVTLKWFNISIPNIEIADFLDDPYKYFNELLSNKFNNINIRGLPYSEGILEIYVLEERCGEGLTKNINIEIDTDFIGLVNNLIDNMSEIGQTLFTDLKPENSCPLYDSTGKLTNLIALDLDAKFTYNYIDIQSNFKAVTGLDITIEDIKQMCKDIMFLEYMFVLLVWYDPDNITEEKKREVRFNILYFIQERLSSKKLLKIMSLFYYLIISEIRNFTKRRNYEVYDIGFKFPLIHYILASRRYTEKPIINEDTIANWFITKPYKMLSNKIYPGITIEESTTILPADKIFVEEPVVSNDADNEFAYAKYGGFKSKKRKSMRSRKVTKNKKRFTKRRKH